ncbi:SseB family protein [Microbacterium thalassium]|uniref:SseB protein N-terminal domain-containing protein n=1 Tax=Microbacterium thalassium TaxID=362649 RepID=A0A7X0FP75_9MICO|nr:SseB family protein [Microbacterium thalassium]MBB6391164.1 hypothetical protein [Microbacterium thalassium]GLK23725.1 hypothetical protein GCM10017607_10430 [Microbacterium thalassium]
MAIFSRGKRTRDDDTTAEAAQPAAEATEAAAAAESAGDESVPHVGISVSTFGQAASAPQVATPGTSTQPRSQTNETAPAQTETIPGLRDNVVLRAALAALPEKPDSIDLLNVARQLMQGHVFLRVKGDARALISEGKDLPLAVATLRGKRFALAYSSGAALQASVRQDGDAQTSAMGQPVLAVIRHVLAGTYDGLILDHASAPARAVLPRPLLEKMVEAYDEQLTIKQALAAERTPQTAAQVADALTKVKLWVAVNRAAEGGPVGVAESRTKSGERFLEVYSHPLEVVAGGRSDQAAPITAAQLAKALHGDDGLTGVIVDPRGPWIRLRRDDLTQLLALTD